METVVDLLNRALPDEIPFYHLGDIRRAPVSASETALGKDRCALAYRLRGDVSAALLVTVDRGLDLSMYAEAGNLLASRLATELAGQAGLDVMISPPHELGSEQLEALWKRLGGTEILLERDYVHLHAGVAVPMRVLVIADDQGAGHA